MNAEYFVPRIDDVVEAFHFAMDKYPSAKMIAVGFSMGGNLALRLAGLHDHIQQRLSAVLSICQGYDVIRYFLKKKNFFL